MADRFLISMSHMPPLARFAVVLLILLSMPALCRRPRLPVVVGLLAAGVLIGPSGPHISGLTSRLAIGRSGFKHVNLPTDLSITSDLMAELTH